MTERIDRVLPPQEAARAVGQELRAFDWRCLGLAFLMPLVEVFRRVSFSLPTMLAQTTTSPYLLAAGVAGGIAIASIALLALAFKGRAIGLAAKALTATVLGTGAFAGMFVALALPAGPFLAPVAFFLLGLSLGTFACGWIEAYARQNPLVATVCAGLSILVGSLAYPWVIANEDPRLMAGVLATCLVASGMLLKTLAQRGPSRQARSHAPTETVQSEGPSPSAPKTGSPRDTDRPSLRGVFHAATTATSIGFALIFFSWGVMAVPPAPYAGDHKAYVFIVGGLIALGVIAWFAWSLRTTPRYSALRQRAFFLLPVFAVFLAYFSFIRMLNPVEGLKDVLSIGYNMSVAGFSALFVGTTVMRLREKGSPVEFAVAPVLLTCMTAYALGALAYEEFGNAAMYLQIVFTTVYIVSLSSISTRKASLNDDARIEQRCRALAQEHGLSAREHEVLLLLASDYSIERIAEELSISIETVRTHKKRIYAKTDVHKHEDLMRAVRAAR